MAASLRPAWCSTQEIALTQVQVAGRVRAELTAGRRQQQRQVLPVRADDHRAAGRTIAVIRSRAARPSWSPPRCRTVNAAPAQSGTGQLRIGPDRRDAALGGRADHPALPVAGQQPGQAVGVRGCPAASSGRSRSLPCHRLPCCRPTRAAAGSRHGAGRAGRELVQDRPRRAGRSAVCAAGSAGSQRQVVDLVVGDEAGCGRSLCRRPVVHRFGLPSTVVRVDRPSGRPRITRRPVSSATSRTAVSRTCSPGRDLPLGSVQSSYFGR